MFGLIEEHGALLVESTPVTPGVRYGHPVYITVESDQKTFKIEVAPDGSFGAATLFAEDGGEAVAQDKNGNVYLAAEQVLVYNPDGKLIGDSEVSWQRTQSDFSFSSSLNVPSRPL